MMNDAPHQTVVTNRRQIKIGIRPLLMGVLNVTPDSFSDGGLYFQREAAIARAMEMVAAGADILDIGGESSRPGAHPVTPAEEIDRVVPVIREITRRCDVPISIDSWKASTVRAAVEAGAEIINDITGLDDPAMRQVAAESGCAVVAMHMRGRPWDMQELPPAPDIFQEVWSFFADVLKLGIENTKMVLDPGIGFGKTPADNLVLLSRLGEFKSFGRPLLAGVSRKSFIGKITGAPVAERLPGSLAAAVMAYSAGAAIIRCHDVKENLQALLTAAAILNRRVDLS